MSTHQPTSQYLTHSFLASVASQKCFIRTLRQNMDVLEYQKEMTKMLFLCFNEYCLNTIPSIRQFASYGASTLRDREVKYKILYGVC